MHVQPEGSLVVVHVTVLFQKLRKMGTISSVQRKGAPKRTASEMDPTTPVQRELVAAWVTDEVVEEFQRRQLFAFANSCKARRVAGLDLFSLEPHELLDMGLPPGELYAFERMRRISLNMPEVERMRGLIFADSPESCAFPGTAYAATGAKELVELPQGHGIKAGDRIRLQLEEEDAGDAEHDALPAGTDEGTGEAGADDGGGGNPQRSQRGQVVTVCAPVGPTSIGIRPHRRGRTGRVHVFRCLTEVTAMHKGLNECGVSRLYPALAWLPSLRTVNFAFNALGDEAMPYLLRALQQNRGIVRVRLDGNVSEEPISTTWIGRLHIAAALNAMASGEEAVVLRDLELDDNLLAYLCGCDAELELHQAQAERAKREAEALKREREMQEKALRDALHKRHNNSHEHRDLFGNVVVDEQAGGKHRRRRRKKKRQHGDGSGHGQAEGRRAEGRNDEATGEANEDEHKHDPGDDHDDEREPLFDDESKDQAGASSKDDESDVPPPAGVGDFLIPAWTAVGVTLPTNRSLTSLNLCQNEITDTGVRRIAEALKSNEKLKSLNLGHNAFTDTGMADLCAALQSNHSLTELCVSGNSLTHHSDHSIRKLLRKNRTLTRIDLGATHVKVGVMADAYAKVAANAARSNEQKTLRLRGLDDDGMGAVAEAMRSNHTVTHIDLCYNPKLTNVGGAKLLEVLSQNSIVTRLDAHTGNDLLHPELIELLVARARKNAAAFKEAHRPISPIPASE